MIKRAKICACANVVPTCLGASKMSERKRKLDIDGSGSEARKSR